MELAEIRHRPKEQDKGFRAGEMASDSQDISLLSQ